MWRRSSKRLAGCIVIELALSLAALAGGYQAGSGSSATVHALAIEDAKGNRAVIAQTDFRVTQALADFVASQLMQSSAVSRPGLLLRWSGIANRPAQPADLVEAIQAALAALAPATVRYGHRSLSVAAEDGTCIASLNPDGTLGFSACRDGVEVTGYIKAAFQMVEPSHGLLERGQSARSFPVQAIAIGKEVTILAMSGEAHYPEGVSPRGLIYAPFSNEADAAPQDARVMAAVRRVLARVK
jgi:hypothetical protein